MKESDYDIAILGAGESGAGAAVLAKTLGMRAFVSDLGNIKSHYKSLLDQHGIEWEEGKHSNDTILSCGEIIKSPGIPDTIALVKEAASLSIPVISEIEFAGRHCKGQTICVTGSNGKTTTTLMTGFMLEKAGLDVAVGGNMGKSFALQLAEGDHDYWVIELSSFQLDGIQKFRPDIAILLNITPDHLDRYAYDFNHYIDSKFRITMNQTGTDHLIYWEDDPVIQKGMKKRKIKAQRYPFSISQVIENDDWQGARLKGSELIFNVNHNYLTMSIHDLALKGKHNLFNSMASGIVGRVLELRKEIVRDSLEHFENVEHRLEFVAKVAGISFINDSKATNINSTWYALESMEHPVIWIAGGVDKGNDYNELLPLVKEKVKAIICLGNDNKKIHKAFKGHIDTILDASTAQEAVNLAYELGYQDDTVLLSPACASFDLFSSYEERGQMFKKAVKTL